MRAEIIVFGLIAAFIVAGVLLTINQASLKVNQINQSLPMLGKAPELIGINNWINSEPLRLADLKGKVVLIDFWTYSCVNCIRTLPYLESWYDKYSGSGLVIIGVHSPEFEFEKNPVNVKAAVTRYEVKYPVAQDNDHATWDAFNNKYWPREYLIDKDGNIRYDHIGEGNYKETEKAIQQLLGVSSNMTNIPSDINLSKLGSPEIYLGYSFARMQLGNSEGFVPERTIDYKPANVTSANIVYLSGQWKNNADHITAVNNSKLFLIFDAKRANIVASGNTTATILIEGFPAEGDDVVHGSLAVNGARLYNIASLHDYVPYFLEIDAQPGLEIYTFTFG